MPKKSAHPIAAVKQDDEAVSFRESNVFPVVGIDALPADVGMLLKVWLTTSILPDDAGRPASIAITEREMM